MKRKGNLLSHCLSYATRHENCALFMKYVLSQIENAAFMWVQNCCKKGIPIESLIRLEKKQSHYVIT